MYDVIVVGAGMAGQVTAGYAARNGKKVLLVEQNHQTGGNMTGFSRKGFYFDGGDQSFESLGVVFPILNELAGFGPADFTKARFRMVSDDFDFLIESPEQVEAALRESFPDEPGIAPLFAEIRKVRDFLNANYDPWDFPLLNNPSVGSLLSFSRWLLQLKRWSTFRYRERALRIINNPGLRNWLTYVGYKRMPYLFFAGFWHLWSNDYWYPIGGMQALHNRLAAAITASGVELRLNTRIRNIVLDSSGKRATGITTDAGETIEGRSIVWAGDYKRLINEVLDPGCFPARTQKKLLGSELTEALVSTYLGLDIPAKELGETLKGANHPFYFPNYNVTFPDGNSPDDVHETMWIALNHFGAENPAAPPEKSTLTLQTFSAFDWQDYWHNGSDSHLRTPEYREFKLKVGRQMVQTAERLVPGLADHVEFMDVGTPLSLERFSLNSIGSSGGWSYDDQVSPVWRLRGLNRIRTPVVNLMCSGHYALWPGGVISAALSGRMVGNMVSGRPALTPVGK